MLTRTRTGLAGEGGISLVEIMVSVTLLGVVLAAFASTLIQSLTNVTADEQLVRGTHLAASELERLRSLDWDDVGMYADDPGYSATSDTGEPTVTLGSSRPEDALAPLPQDSIERDGTTYATDLTVVWVEDPAQPGTTHKELRLRLNWTVRDRPFETTAVTTRAPTLDEVPIAAATDCTAGTIVDFAVTPSIIAVNDGGNLLQEVVVTVETCTPASSVSVTRPGGTTVPVLDTGEGTRWEHTYHVASGGFPPGQEVWTAASVGTDGNDQAEQVVTYATDPGGVLEITGLDLTPGLCVMQRTNTAEDGQLVEPVTLTVTTSGAPTDVRISWTGQPGSAIATGAGDIWTATLPADDAMVRFTDSTITFSVLAVRAGDAAEADETFTAQVQIAGISC